MKRIRYSTMLVLLFLFASFFCIFSACDTNGNSNGIKDIEFHESYCVTFDLVESSFEMYSNTTTGKIEKPNNPIRDGYTFAGWYDSEEFTQLFDFDKKIENDTTIYALWIKNPNKIRFEGNGNTSGEMTDIIVENDTPIKLPSNSFVRDGYIFIGWSDIANGSVKNKDGGWFFMEEGVVTLFACWQAEKYNVMLDNGEENYTQVTITYGEVMPSINMPIRVGYVFSGYYSQKNGKGIKYCDASMRGCREYYLLEDTTLYAYWVTAENTLSFDGNGSTSGGNEYIDLSSLEDVILPDCGFKRLGYTFKSWNEDPDGGGKSYAAGDRFTMPLSDFPVILYATWINNIYNVVLDDNFSSEEYTCESTYDIAAKLIHNPFERYGYKFVVWNDKSDGTGNYYQDGQEVINLCEELNGEVRLYAIWKPVTVLVIFNKCGGKGGTGSSNIAFGEFFPHIVAPTREGYTFGGYYAQENGQGNRYLNNELSAIAASDIGVDGNEVFAYWLPKSNILILDPNNGENEELSLVTATEKVVHLQDYNFNKIGYTLEGWGTKADGSGEFYHFNSDYITEASNSPIRLYAIWTAKLILAVFNGNENTSGSTMNVYGYSDNAIILPNCEYLKMGYEFIGWSRSKNDNDMIWHPDSEYMIEPTDDEFIEFYARWEVKVFSITYELDGGVNSPYNPSKYTYFSSEIILANPTKKGYEFLGWKDSNVIPSNSMGDRNFVAQWKIIYYQIIYIYNGGHEQDSNPKLYTVDTPTFYLNDPVKSNYIFEGWAEGNVVELGSVGNKTFTAQWSGKSYSITYDLNGGVNGDGNPRTYMYDSDPITLKDATKLGYTFIGWTCEQMNINDPIKNVTIPKNSSENRTFKAHWQIIKYNINYILKGGENSLDNPNEYDVTDEILLSDPIRIGYIFDGWREGGIIVQGSTGDLTFTAEWSPIEYEIFILVDETFQEKPKSIKYSIDSSDIIISIVNSDNGPTYSIQIGEEVEICEITNKIGYNLVGWYENADDDSLIMSTVIVLSGSTEDREIIAKWLPIEYTIEYEFEDDVIFDVENPKSYNIESETIVLQIPTRDGYNFIGWMDENGDMVEEIPSGSYGNIKLHATWEEVSLPN